LSVSPNKFPSFLYFSFLSKYVCCEVSYESPSLAFFWPFPFIRNWLEPGLLLWQYLGWRDFLNLVDAHLPLPFPPGRRIRGLLSTHYEFCLEERIFPSFDAAFFFPFFMSVGRAPEIFPSALSSSSPYVFQALNFLFCFIPCDLFWVLPLLFFPS